MIKQNLRKLLLALAMFFFVFTATSVLQKTEVQAAGSYYLQVNKGTNVVTVFKNDGTPYKAFICSVGTATPIGTFSTSQKLRWHTLDGPSYGQYCTRITRGFLFHSVWYYQNGNVASQAYKEYNKLGSTASHGCVRLTVADAKWIYDNCPLSTTVVIIYGSAANDPLGKPESIKVDASQYMGWDPTDPAAGNPYAYLFPSINTSGKGTNVTYGSKFNALSGISASDSLGNDISGKLTYSGNVNTKKLGTYKLDYSVTDALGRTSTASITYKVVDTKKATITGVKKKLTKEYNSTIKLLKSVKAKTVDKKNLTKKIKVKIIYPGTKKEKTYKKSSLKLTKLGTYKINYYVTNPNNKKVTKVTSKVTVKDTKKPKLTGVKSAKKLEYNSTSNLKSGVTSKLVSGKNMTSKIVIKIKAPGSSKFVTLKASGGVTVNYKRYQFKKTGLYTVEYSVANPYNKKAVMKKTTLITIQDTKAPVFSGITATRTVEYGTSLNVFSGVTAKLVSGTAVQKIEATILRPDKQTITASTANYLFNQVGTYTITYKAVNPTGNRAVTAKAYVIVKDTKAPVITIADKLGTVEIGVPYYIYNGVSADLASGAAKITAVITKKDTGDIILFENGEVRFTAEGEYVITYTAINEISGLPNPPTATKSVTIIVTAPLPSENETGNSSENTPENTNGAEPTEAGNVSLDKKEDISIDEVSGEDNEDTNANEVPKEEAKDTEAGESDTDDGVRQQDLE